ncbi:MAG: COG1361 S-layer family protein [Candidatus Nanohaloarchaea archaeon]
MKKTMLVALLLLLPAFAAAQPTTQVKADLVKTEPVPLKTSEYADVWVKFRNTGDTEMQNARIEYVPSFPFSVDPDEQTSWELGTMTPGEEYYVHLQVKVDENAVSGNNTLKFRTSSSSSDVSVTHKVPVEVRSDNNILSIENVGFPEKIGPGETHEMTLTLENMADTHLKNVEVELDLSGKPLATQDTTSKVVTDIPPGERRNLTFDLSADEDAENGAYRVPVTLTYEDESGTSFTRETQTGVIVGGAPELEVGVNQMNLLTPGTRTTLTLRIVNRGVGTARFAELSVNETGSFEILSTDNVYLGNMDSDDYQTAEYELYVKPGADRLQMPVKVSYTTPDGVEADVSQTLELEVYSAAEAQKFGKSGGPGLAAVAVIVLVLAAGGYYYWRRRKRE